MHGGHIGGPKQKNDIPLGNKCYFYANLFNCFGPPTWPPCTYSIGHVTRREILDSFLGGGGMSLFVLLAELAGPRHRSLIGTSLWYCWTLSLIALAGVAFLIRDWRTLCIATGAPAIAVTLIYL